jgi:hypothetical protein
MSIDLSMINANLVFWVVAILVIILIFGIVRFFFRHLLHFFFRGCGFILLIAALLYILHIFKVF